MNDNWCKLAATGHPLLTRSTPSHLLLPPLPFLNFLLMHAFYLPIWTIENSFKKIFCMGKQRAKLARTPVSGDHKLHFPIIFPYF
jgi:hypothetical protein